MRLLAQHVWACLGLDFGWIDLILDSRQDLQTDEGLEWIARELAAGTSAMPSAIVDSEEISLVKISN
jgi:hypothetical protein